MGRRDSRRGVADRGRSRPIALRSRDGAVDYRQRLNDAYLSTHFGRIRTPDLVGIRRDFPFFRRHFLPHLPRDERSQILDLGCGYGSMLYTLRRHGYSNVAGVDISPEQVQLASRLGIEGVVQADLLAHLRTRPAAYDVILAIDVLEHFSKSELIDVVDAVAAALRPGGRFIVHTVNAESPFFGRLRYGDLTHELALTSRSIGQLLRLGGFEAVAVYEIAPAVHGVSSAARRAVWGGLRGLLGLYLAAETGTIRGHILSQNLVAVAVKPMGWA